MIRFVSSFRLLSAPLLYAIENKMTDNDVSIHYLPEEEVFNQLKEGKADAGLLSPLAYGKSTGEILLVRDFMISSPKAGSNALLFFKGNLTNINTIHYPENPFTGDYDRFIAELVLKEFYEIETAWIPVAGLTPDLSALEKYKVIFIPHPQAFDIYSDYTNFIDLSEEWSLRTDLPMVQGLLCVHRSFHNSDFLKRLRLSRELGLRNLMKIAKTYAAKHPRSWDIYFDLLNENYLYYSNQSGWDALQKLISYLFFYARTDYITELKFFEEKSSN